MGIFSFFGLGGNNVREALRKGGVVIDVRTAQEFDNGHVPGAINIPVDRLDINVERIRSMNRPVVTCCSSGARSGDAVQFLKSKGIREVYNGGSWESVWRNINRL